MEKVKIAGLPSVPMRVWVAHKELLHTCRKLQAAGFGQGTDPYEAALDALKKQAYDHNLLLGHVNAIAAECAK